MGRKTDPIGTIIKTEFGSITKVARGAWKATGTDWMGQPFTINRLFTKKGARGAADQERVGGRRAERDIIRQGRRRKSGSSGKKGVLGQGLAIEWPVGQKRPPALGFSTEVTQGSGCAPVTCG